MHILIILYILLSKYFTFCKYKYNFVLSNKKIKMNIVLTGSIGHISKPMAMGLIKAGHIVSIITNSATKVNEIVALGATPLIGSIEDANFMKHAFENADAVYLMIPPKWSVTNWLDYQKTVCHNYVDAIVANNVSNVLVLSSVGAHMINGAGPVDGLAYLESLLNALPSINAVYLRPSYFYYNLYSMIPLIKNLGIMGSNIPPTHKLVLAHTSDIAQAGIEIFANNKFNGKQIVYIASDEKTMAEITQALGQAIGSPDLKWVEFTDDQTMGGMLQSGLSDTIASGYTAMGKALREKEMEADYWKHRPDQLGVVKLDSFAKEFATVYAHS
jgi:uncharacterized protein YbjT (DUF2867 family)